ncbi:Bax inhibitor-1/YccA family protein [Glacieibacterium frigidum]|uniref:Bax inhibitor-1/YccA family protein n=1 Tax=Glacieibacterium frigidum TaxID=2593303 RepID=A0A552U724_9SPHN|nr:Bax inhibitor-1/YccA family protein [Glacieibacterium frigidum]TRW13979.1 Bax inhibitor-1/YccA family protein [Glacieibacterium frigidum]
MANQFDPRIAYPRATGVAAGDASYDAGLRSYMLSVYNYMASGVLLTGVVALLFARGGAESWAAQIFMQPGILKWIVMLAPFALVMVLSFGINKLSETQAKGLFWLYAALMGASLSTILLVYTGASVASTFFATAAGFGALSLYGYTTKRDLSGMGKFLLMGLVGLIIASLINVFTQSSTMSLIISVVGVFLFAGLTVYDTQKIKEMYYQVQGSEMIGKTIIMGALTLYLDFINLFLFLLRFMGDRR